MDKKIAQEKLLAASDSLAPRFSWQLNAATYRYGVICDVIVAFIIAAAMTVLWALTAHFHLPVIPKIFGVLTLAPLVACALANFKVRNARDGVVQWIASQPFPVEGVTAVLAGAGETFEIWFVNAAPSRDSVMDHLQRVSEDVFVLEAEEGAKVMTARFGIFDSKHNLIKGPQSRFLRMKSVVETALTAIHAEHPIDRIQII